MTAAALASFKTENNNLETFSLLWLDASTNATAENIEAQQRLRASINHLTIFQDDQLCENYIRSLSHHDQIVLIVSGQFGREIVTRIHSLRQLSSVYVYCMDKDGNEQWFTNLRKVSKFSIGKKAYLCVSDVPRSTEAWRRSKMYQEVTVHIEVKGVIAQLDELVTQIQSDQEKRNASKLDEKLPFSIFNSSVSQEQSTTGMNGQFVHSQLLIDCLLRMKSPEALKNELIAECKREYEGNMAALNILREFEQDYSPDRAIWWYTRDAFLYRIMNKALRTQNIDILFLLRFLIRDIEQQLKKYQCLSCLRLYRGQLMSINELQLLVDSIGQLISINSFLSTSVERQIALAFLTSATPSDGNERVLFEIVADPKLGNVKSFANVTSFSYFPQEEEVLVMLGSIFRLIDIRCNDEGVWIIQMALCNDSDHDLKFVFEQMKKSHRNSDENTNLLTFSNVLFEMGKYDLAEKYLHRLLNELPEDDEDIYRCYYALGNLAKNKDDLDSSLAWHYKSMKIKQKKLRTDNPELAMSYSSISSVYRKKGDLDQAIEALNKALPIFQQAYGNEHPDVANCLNSIGYVYLRLKNYSKAMDCFRKALSINEKHFTAYHPFLGILHNSIADANRGLRNYEETMKHTTISLKIFEKSLPPQHYQIAWTFEIMGNMYEEKKELVEALNYYRKAASIYCDTLPATHYYVVGVKQSIERVASQIN